MKKKKFIIPLIIFFIIIMIIIFFRNIVDFIVNIEWFKEVGYLSVYLTQIKATLILFVPMFILCYIIIYLYYRSIKKNIAKWDNKEIKTVNKFSKLFVLANIIISFIISFSFANTYWYRVLQFVNSTDFKTKDPIFNLDISFYVFKLPLIESIYNVLISILIGLIIITVVLYLILNTKDMTFHNGSFANPFNKIKEEGYIKSGLTRFAGKQAALASFFIMLFISAGFILRALNIVYSSRGVVYGAGYTDVHVSLIFYLIISAVCFISSFIVLFNILRLKFKPIIISVCIIIGLIIIQNIAYPVVERLIVKSNQQALENKYIKYNMKYTQKAFKVDNITSKTFEVKNDLTKTDITSNSDIINNIKVNSYKQALEYYNQVEVKRNYYNFNDVDVDRYNINGNYNQVFLSPREIDINSLESGANIWQNRHLVYTHGYGVVMNKVNSVSSTGQPDFVMNDIPIQNSTDINIKNPRIYFGEKTNDYAVVNTSLGEFDYPREGTNQETKYDGKSGIKMSFFNKLLFAANENDVNFFLSGYIKSNSKILINRNIMDRVKKIAPFLTYDKDPYLVISNNKVYWIIDAYTTSDKYPYSEPYKNGINYIRNSVKVVIDAYDGTTDFYLADKDDPIAVSYSKIFPDLFKDMSKMPDDLKAHLRYPEDIYNIQASVLGKYHVTDSGIFFNSEDLWQVSENQENINDEKANNEATYVVMKLDNSSQNEMVLLEYFNMKGKTNMVGMLGARMDGDNYGKLVLYKFPPGKTIDSPQLFKQKIKQDTEISKELTLWNAQGSEVQFGDTVIVPINNSLLYIEPLYLRATGKNSIPEMKRVIVAYGDKIISADSANDAFSKIFGTEGNAENTGTQTQNNEQNANNNTNNNNTSNAEVNTKGLSAEDLKKANDLYNKALDAQKSGDWAQYGSLIKQLGDLLNNASK